MHAKISEILERELKKLDSLSKSSPDPLAVAEIKSLDVLIRAYRSFSDPKDPPKQPASDDPAVASTESLVSDLLSGNQTKA